MKVVSLGAGVQSTALLLRSVEGEFGPAPDLAIFADTGWEPRAVYEHLDRLEAAIAPFPMYRVSAGNIRNDALDADHRFASMPLYVRDDNGDKGQLRRQCTHEYKIAPIRRKIREILGTSHPKPGSVRMLLGISIDEALRMRTSPVQYIEHCYPLVDARISRADCERYLSANGWGRVPKSACVGCPFKSNASWLEMRRDNPKEWADAVDFDRQVRTLRDSHGTAYLHRRGIPLDEVRSDEDAGQMVLSGFDAECEGICGV